MFSVAFTESDRDTTGFKASGLGVLRPLFSVAFTPAFYDCVTNHSPLGSTSVSGVWAQLGPCSQGCWGGCREALVWKASPRSSLQDGSPASPWLELGPWRSPPHSGQRSTGRPTLLVRGSSQELGSGSPTWPPQGCRSGAEWAGGPGWGWPGRPHLGATRSRPGVVSAPEALGCIDSAALWNSGQTVHSCLRGNGFSLNL